MTTQATVETYPVDNPRRAWGMRGELSDPSCIRTGVEGWVEVGADGGTTGPYFWTKS